MIVRPTADRSTWKTLLRHALDVVDSLETVGYGKLRFRLGGGTVLMFRFDHRISKDIDLFTDDAQALGFLSPRLNDFTAALTTEYQEQPNGVKLILPFGDIDFVVAGTVTNDGRSKPASMIFETRTIDLEPVSEILAKKILYRAATFKPRDVFDMATAIDLDPASAKTALRATTPVHEALRRRLADLRDVTPAALMEGILITEVGRHHLDDMIEKVERAIP